MALDIPPRLEEVIRQKVATGHYASAGEVIADALEVLDEREQLREIRLRKLREQVQAGLDQSERGACTPMDMEQIIAKAQRMRQASRGESA